MRILFGHLSLWVVFLTGLANASGEANERPSPVRLASTLSPAPRTNGVLVLTDVLRQVVADNPSLKSARAGWEAAKQRVPQARAWEDPRAEFDTVAGRFVSVPPDSFADQRLMIEQTVPLAGRNRLRGEAAQDEAAVAFAQLRRRELDIVAASRTAFYHFADAVEQLHLVDANLALLNEFARISRKKYEAGTTAQSDVLAAETEASKLEESRYDVLRQISDAESELNVLMNRPAQAPLARPGPLEPGGLPPDLQQLQTTALEQRPEIFLARMKVSAARARLAEAKREWIPDPSLRVAATRYNEANQPASEITAGVAINLPWLNHGKYRARIEEARQVEAGAEFDLASARNEAQGLVREALNQATTLHHHVELFRDRILVLARQNALATQQAYETGQAPFLNLLDAQRTLQAVEATYWNHVSDYLGALARLAAVVGTDTEPPAERSHEQQK